MKIKTRQKKKPSDYPLLSFRVSESDAKRIMSAIENIKNRRNRDSETDQKVTRNNHVFVEALMIGLEKLNKK